MSILIPAGKEAEMFGFYAFCGKSSSVMGPLLFGQVSFLMGGNQRIAVLLQRVRVGGPVCPPGPDSGANT